jgi:hypothetical protein
MQGCFTVMGLLLLALGLGCLWVLVKIGWSSDGPGALFFYIGLVGGLWGAWLFLSPVKPKE